MPSLRYRFELLIKLLDKFDIQSHISCEKINKSGSIELILDINGNNIVKFNDKIGIRYDAHKMMRLAVASSFYRMRENVQIFYEEIITETHKQKNDENTWVAAREKAIEFVRNNFI